MSEDTFTDARPADGGPCPPPTARPADEVKLVELRKLRLERVVLVGVAVDGSVERAERSVEELHRLAETAGAEVLDAMIQRRARPDAGTFIGKGKAKELAGAVKALEADTVIMDDELSPGQLRHLEELVDAKVIDRTVLILDIFAQHATSREGKAQVELAQLNYMLPRLRGWGESLTRVGSGMGSGGPIGTRGPGETKMEVDRRRIRRRITKLRRDLVDMARTRDVKRRGRERAGIPAVALVGYTNAGKSTLLNRLSGAGVLVEDKLFSTLDPTTRRLDLPGGRAATFTDTVGFIAKLPHDLVEAFKSTLEEVARADLIVHLVDAAQPDPAGQMAAVRSVLGEVGAADVPELLVLNKADLLDEVTRARLARLFPGVPMLSAATGEGVDDLLAAIATRLPHPEIDLTALVPYDRGDLVDRAHREGEILEVDHVAEGTRLRLRAPAALAHALAPYRQPAPDDEDAGSAAAAWDGGTAAQDRRGCAGGGRGCAGRSGRGSGPTEALSRQGDRNGVARGRPGCLDEVPADVDDHVDAAPGRGVVQADGRLELAVGGGGGTHDGVVGHRLAGRPVHVGDQRDHVAVAREGAEVPAGDASAANRQPRRPCKQAPAARRGRCVQLGRGAAPRPAPRCRPRRAVRVSGGGGGRRRPSRGSAPGHRRSGRRRGCRGGAGRGRPGARSA